MMHQSAIYRGTVDHIRMRPKQHRLRYQVFSLLLDLDELSELDRGYWLFGYNRFAPLAFYDTDHGPTTGEKLRPWVEERLRDAGLTCDGGPIRLLCYPRIFGYAFNPLSVYFCYRNDGGLSAILYEVRNTFAERHTYVIPAEDDGGPTITQRCRKSLYVSPFLGMDADYLFHIRPPMAQVNLLIRHEDADGLVLAATFRGTRMTLTLRSLAKVLMRFPLQTITVIAGIRWEALRLWIKGLRPVAREPAAAPVRSSVWNNK